MIPARVLFMQGTVAATLDPMLVETLMFMAEAPKAPALSMSLPYKGGVLQEGL